MKSLSSTHLLILLTLSENGSLTKAEITRLLNLKAETESKPLIGGFSVSGRLSELCGLSLVSMKYAKVQLLDNLTMEIRFVRKPVWSLTKTGLEVVRSNTTNLPPEILGEGEQ